MVTEKHITREEVYKREIAEMQSQNHHLLVRIKELNSEVEKLKKQIMELIPEIRKYYSFKSY